MIPWTNFRQRDASSSLAYVASVCCHAILDICCVNVSYVANFSSNLTCYIVVNVNDLGVCRMVPSSVPVTTIVANLFSIFFANWLSRDILVCLLRMCTRHFLQIQTILWFCLLLTATVNSLFYRGNWLTSAACYSSSSTFIALSLLCIKLDAANKSGNCAWKQFWC